MCGRAIQTCNGLRPGAPHIQIMSKIEPAFAPDFYVVGAAKAGTTAIWNWLREHPDIFLPAVKEPGFFSYVGRCAAPRKGPYDPDYVSRITSNAAAYADLYAGAECCLTGDVSPVYLCDEHAPARIAHARPNARIVIVLRDPVERAFSQFRHHVRDHLEPCRSFETALAAESERLHDGWSWGHGYATHGHYASQIARYLSVFPRKHILFLEFAQLQTEPETCWRRLCAHLGVDHLPMPGNERVNVAPGGGLLPARPGVARALQHPGPIQSRLKQLVPPALRTRLRRSLEGTGAPVPELTEATRFSLAARYLRERPLIEALSGLSLGHWTNAA